MERNKEDRLPKIWKITQSSQVQNGKERYELPKMIHGNVNDPTIIQEIKPIFKNHPTMKTFKKQLILIILCRSFLRMENEEKPSNSFYEMEVLKPYKDITRKL